MDFVDPFARLEGMPAVLDRIVRYFDHHTLRNIKLVCRAWNKAMNTRHTWNKRLQNKTSSDYVWKEISQQLPTGMSDLYEESDCPEKEKYGLIFQAAQILDHNWRKGICKEQSTEFNVDEGDFHGNNLDSDLIAMGSCTIAVGFPSGTIKVFSRKNLIGEKDLFHGEGLKFLKFEGDFFISASFSLLRIWHKDTKHLLESLELADMKSDGLQKFASFGSGNGLLVCWQRLNDAVNKNCSQILSVWRLKPLNDESMTGVLQLVHTESQTHLNFPSKSFVNEKFIVTVWEWSVTKPSLMTAPIILEIRSTSDFTVLNSHTADDCVDFKGLNFVNDIFPILVLQRWSSKIELVDCTRRSWGEFNSKSYPKKYLKCYCLGSNSKFAILSNSSFYRIIDFRSAVFSAFQQTTNSSYINLGRICSLRGLELNESIEIQNFQMDELSLLHIEGDQNNGTVTLKLVLLDFLDLDAISRPVSSLVESIPSVAMQNINQTSSIAPGGTIESGDASPLNTTSSPLRLACRPQEVVGGHHGLPVSKMIDVDCGYPSAQMTAIPKSNYQKQQHPSPRSEIPISEKRLKTVSSFVNSVHPVAPLPSPTDTRKRVATQTFSVSGLMILPSKFRLPLNRDTSPPTTSGRGEARSTELDCGDRGHPHKWNENQPRDRECVRVNDDYNGQRNYREENLVYDDDRRSDYSLLNRTDGRSRDHFSKSGYYKDNCDSNERLGKLRTDRDDRQHRSRSVDRYYQSGPRKRPSSVGSVQASSDREHRHGVRQPETFSQYPYGTTSNPSYDPSSLASADFRQQLYNDQMNWAVQYDLNYLYKMRLKYPGSYAIWYQAYCAQHSTYSVWTGAESVIDGMTNFEASRTNAHSGLNEDNQSHFSRQNRASSSGFNQSQYSEYSIYDMDEPSVATTNEQQDLNPPKFTHPHVIGRFSFNGALLCVQPNLPSEGVSATVELHDLGILLVDLPSLHELGYFPGPLVPIQTYKKQIIRFCEQKISRTIDQFPSNHPAAVDHKSYVLFWELLLLLVRQNGTFIGSDIVELLLKNQEVAEDPPTAGSAADRTFVSQQTEESLTNKFREFLLFGHQQKALEWAMTYGLWGHALFLASKMGQRTESYVMYRFTSAMPLTDPLQTLYQLSSGRQPTAVTSSSAGNWRSHLAMIISNSSDRSATGWPVFDKESIVMMGDTLSACGFLLASHFCYLIAGVEFGDYNQTTSSKLVLLGSSVLLPFESFATNEAIQCTEIYEYARQLNDPDFIISSLQSFKFLYGIRLTDHGRYAQALQYCEAIGNVIMQSPCSLSTGLIEKVYLLGSMLKFNDPEYCLRSVAGTDGSTINDPDWLKKLENTISATRY